MAAGIVGEGVAGTDVAAGCAGVSGAAVAAGGAGVSGITAGTVPGVCAGNSGLGVIIGVLGAGDPEVKSTSYLATASPSLCVKILMKAGIEEPGFTS